MVDTEYGAKGKENDSDSKSSSENMEGASGEDPEVAADPRPAKKRYHRHTLHQIQEMERVFKECPHPDEKQRQLLSKELNLSTRQIKFWFQNKRTQMKAHHERQDNSVLRKENEKLKAENFALREAVRTVSCPNCGGPANLAEMSFEEQQLRIENVRLREEIERITAMAAKYIGGGRSAQLPPLSAASPTGSVGALDTSIQIPHSTMGGGVTEPTVADIAAHPFGLTEAEKPLVVELAVASMEELLQVAQAGEPLWIAGGGATQIMDQEVYLQRFPRGIGPTPPGLTSETSRHTGLVIMNFTSLVESFMDPNRWADLFSSIVSRVKIVEVLSTGVAGTYDGAIQLMYAEFQVPTPLVPTRENYFLRYSKRVDNLWVVVDVSIDSLRGNPPPALLRCRRRPSGCVIAEMPSGYSKVTWVEHVEADTKSVHKLYQSYVDSGMAFGAKRWLCTLQRQCERIASVLANNIPSRDLSVIPNPEGRRSMLKLAERMTNNFCGGVSASTAQTWVTLAGSGADDVRVVIRRSVDDPGRPPGVVLSAATSLRLPVPTSKIFQFLRDERYRTEWDILSNTGAVEEMFYVANGPDPGNCVSLLRVNTANSNQSNMLILQECCTDESCSLVVYAPVDIAAMSAVLNGGDPDTVMLLPSGFAILPDGPQDCNSTLTNPILTKGSAPSAVSPQGSSLLTVAFQILLDHVPRLSLGSVATVNKLISNTVIRIKSALLCNGA
ncbi:hypothetical protein KP509_01G001800 [Ceratopteris richardii]|nr:hypothetical protein KP509_01G001800 [Ceratopteris richardii]KAH7445300.1 hypothetical protein KP509_01G001800 [Ceratopteris richardii]KAH7445301.1 hypothetical protein KP509_01G001800 [Ceratopteris richardii]KAH7445305.1 hypothetical protein KP509_01G001800 [Ceratopteris richardii]KAH7445306.1 hypothetical protein KP509_01G001800 [Ceratopteris richardii]